MGPGEPDTAGQALSLVIPAPGPLLPAPRIAAPVGPPSHIVAEVTRTNCRGRVVRYAVRIPRTGEGVLEEARPTGGRRPNSALEKRAGVGRIAPRDCEQEEWQDRSQHRRAPRAIP